jgi:myo-inositol 2-dehydrogenase/D-chiro-inositol 1-dehydrogenase
MMIHDFDMARFLMGDEIVEVMAVGGVLIDEAIAAAGDIDTALVTLRFASGAFGTIDNSRRAVYGYDQRAEVFGSAGCIRTDNEYPNSAFLIGAEGVRRDRPLRFFLERYRESYIAELTAFVGAVLKDEETAVNGQDGRMAVVLGLAAGLSYRENRPVALTEIEPNIAAKGTAMR